MDKRYLLIILMLFLFSYWLYSEVDIIKVDINGNSVDFINNEYLEYYENGKIKRGQLHKDTIIDDMKYKNGLDKPSFDCLEFYNTGIVHSGVLAENIRRNNFFFLKDTRIYFHEKGSISIGFLAEPIQINNISFIGGENIDKNYDYISFDYNGNIDSGTLAKDFIYDKYTFKSGTRIYFSDMGFVVRGVLANEIKIDNISFGVNTKITFFRNSKQVRSCHFDENKTIHINNQKIEVRWFIYFYYTGEIESVYLPRETKINNILFSTYGWAPLHFYKSGSVKAGLLEGEQIINGYLFRRYYDVYTWFYESGNIKSGFLKNDIIINNIPISKDGYIKFYESGNVCECLLSENIELITISKEAIYLKENSFIILTEQREIYGFKLLEQKNIIYNDNKMTVPNRSQGFHPFDSNPIYNYLSFSNYKENIVDCFGIWVHPYSMGRRDIDINKNIKIYCDEPGKIWVKFYDYSNDIVKGVMSLTGCNFYFNYDRNEIYSLPSKKWLFFDEEGNIKQVGK